MPFGTTFGPLRHWARKLAEWLEHPWMLFVFGVAGTAMSIFSALWLLVLLAAILGAFHRSGVVRDLPLWKQVTGFILVALFSLSCLWGLQAYIVHRLPRLPTAGDIAAAVARLLPKSSSSVADTIVNPKQGGRTPAPAKREAPTISPSSMEFTEVGQEIDWEIYGAQNATTYDNVFAFYAKDNIALGSDNFIIHPDPNAFRPLPVSFGNPSFEWADIFWMGGRAYDVSPERRIPGHPIWFLWIYSLARGETRKGSLDFTWDHVPGLLPKSAQDVPPLQEWNVAIGALTLHYSAAPPTKINQGGFVSYLFRPGVAASVNLEARCFINVASRIGGCRPENRDPLTFDKFGRIRITPYGISTVDEIPGGGE